MATPSIRVFAALVCTLTSYYVPISSDIDRGIDSDKAVDYGQKRVVVETAFRHFNPNVSDGLVTKFLEVTRAYHLDDEPLFRKCISQICLESSANHSSLSPTGAVGIGQIVPTTAFDVLRHVSDEEASKMRSLGAKSIRWALNGEYSSHVVDGKVRYYISREIRKKAIAWLQDPTNNLILWAYMMKDYTSTMKHDRAFLAYRIGEGGAIRYASNPSSHPYLAGMRRITSLIKKKERGA